MTPETIMSQEPDSQIVSDWLAQRATTANEKNLSEHLNLISRNVRLLGVPDFDMIDYENWARQCTHEFTTNALKRVAYEGVNILGAADQRIMFQTLETVEGTDGTVHLNRLEIVIEKESDGLWRVIHENVLP